MSKRIQGITIVIDGNTAKLNDALKDTQSVISSTNSELKSLNQALKLDPNNVELLAEKQDVLKTNIAATTEKLETLKEAQRQMGDYNSLTDEQKENYRALSVEISKSETALNSMNEELRNMNKIDLTKVKETMSKIGDVALDVVKKMAQVTGAVAGALAGVVVAGVKSYADLEKAQKGSERLFGESFDTVKKNASSAYKTMGLSATEYYDQVNTYAVGLKNALGGDTEKAAELSDAILKAQADIVAATGVSQDSVQSAMAGVMRGNYTMLDNLRLGIKGSKEGMQEVIDKVNEWNAANGNATKYQMGNYADMEQALVDYTKMVGVAGTAQKDLGNTISGSLTQTKAALDNFLNGSGSAEELAEMFTNLATNISNAVIELAPSILDGIVTLVQTLLPQVASLLITLIPQLLSAITNMINKVLNMITSNTAELKKTISTLVNSVVTFFVENLPTIIEIGLTLLLAIASGIADNLDTLIPAIVECILKIVELITNNLDKIIEVAAVLIVELAKGLILALPKLLASVPKIVTGIVTSIKNVKDKMVDGASTLMNKFKDGIVNKIGPVAAKAKDVVVGFWEKTKKFITETNWLELGKNILKGILNGMLNFGTIVKDTIKKVGKKITGAIKSFFGIESPSKLMRDEVGQYLTAGIGKGFEKGIPQTIRDVNAAMTDLNNGIQSSLNPVINPTANTNPLIVQIENFNNNRQQDVQALAEELEFYRKNSALARGGN